MIPFIKFIGIVVLLLLVFIGVEYLWKGTRPDPESESDFEILAHRGVHQNYEKGVYDPVSGCEAKHIFKPSHQYIENTIESIGAAFGFGATMVEIDIRKTADSNLVVFHDWMLNCRTDGEGEVKDHPVSYLKTLDIGYGYSYDGGESYPFRGRCVGKMSTLAEVLKAFPTQRFLIDHKDGDTESVQNLVSILRQFPEENAARLTYWGPQRTLDLLQKEYPQIRRFFVTRQQAKDVFVKFLLSFGLTGIPDELHGLTIGVPVRYTKYLWGWPYRLIGKLHRAGMRVYLMVDSLEDAGKIKDLPIDGVVTDYVEIVGPYFRQMDDMQEKPGRYASGSLSIKH